MKRDQQKRLSSTESALELRSRKLKELEDKLAREKRQKRLDDFKYKRLIEMQDKKHGES